MVLLTFSSRGYHVFFRDPLKRGHAQGAPVLEDRTSGAEQKFGSVIFEIVHLTTFHLVLAIAIENCSFCGKNYVKMFVKNWTVLRKSRNLNHDSA